MYTTSDFCKSEYGEKLYKISIDGGFTCPNRDGTCGTGGCIFCSSEGSGDFAGDRVMSVMEQIEAGKKLVARKVKPGSRYIAYFQAFTNTYAPVEKLRALFMEAISHPDIAVLSIATRPDCLPEEVVELIQELNQIKPVWVELGLQTIHEKTASYIRRGYELPVYEKALTNLKAAGVHVITHVILGLPGESAEDMLETVEYLAAGIIVDQKSSAVRIRTDGIKLQLLHVLEGTDLAGEYRAGRVEIMSMEEYIPLLADCIKRLPADMVVHRITGDGPKKILIAPLWTGDKKRVMNSITKYFKDNGVVQGELFKEIV